MSTRIRLADAGYLTPEGDTVCGEHSEPKDRPLTTPHGGETDTPHHCIECEALLPTQLTDAGYNYVAEHVLEHLLTGRGRAEVLRSWLYRWPDVLPVIWDHLEECGSSDRQEVLRWALKGAGLE